MYIVMFTGKIILYFYYSLHSWLQNYQTQLKFKFVMTYLNKDMVCFTLRWFVVVIFCFCFMALSLVGLQYIKNGVSLKKMKQFLNTCQIKEERKILKIGSRVINHNYTMNLS